MNLVGGHYLYSSIPIAPAIEDLAGDQVIALAEIILNLCSHGREKRPVNEYNRLAVDKLVAEIHYNIDEIQEIKEAIINYYN